MRPSSSPSEAGAGLFGAIQARGAARAAVSDESWLRAMLDVEGALAVASAEAGVIPAEAAAAIEAVCAGLCPDPDALGRAAAAHGNPVLPLVETIRASVPDDFRPFVHRGATSQDVVDTAAMLVSRRALVAIRSDLDGATGAAAELARVHRDTPMVGRTLLRQAVPITFGMKAAGWLTGLAAADDGLAGVPFAAQLGGAAGTLAGFGAAGPAVLSGFAARLDLPAPDLPWHADRTRPARLATALGIAAGAIGKVARDVTLLAQSEVAEVSEASPGGSSAMPHKRNAVAAISALSCAAQAPGLVATVLAAMVHEHERAAGAWHAEWRPQRDLLVSVGSAAAWLHACLAGLVVHPDAMRANLDRAVPAAEAGTEPDLPYGSAGHFVDVALARLTGVDHEVWDPTRRRQGT